MDANRLLFRKLYLLNPLPKFFSVFYFVLLPVFYAEHLITSKELGTVGALFIGMLIIGAVFVVRWLHGLKTKKLLQLAAFATILSTVFLFYGVWQTQLSSVVIAYALMGAGTGIATSGLGVVAAALTKRGDRFYQLAKLGSISDIMRILLPITVAAILAVSSSTYTVFLVMAVSVLFYILARTLPEQVGETDTTALEVTRLRKNKPFRFFIAMEFADSFSSSQLFVFLPILFLAKGFTLQKSLGMQSFIFLGYLVGRWLVSYLAKRYSGAKSIAYAELGMILSLILLLVTKQPTLLYIISFFLGIFARGTAPTLKAVIYDTLEPNQMKRGSAAHVLVGDSGSALAQLLFGFLVAARGASAPFIVSAIVAGFIAVACLIKPPEMQYYN